MRPPFWKMAAPREKTDGTPAGSISPRCNLKDKKNKLRANQYACAGAASGSKEEDVIVGRWEAPDRPWSPHQREGVRHRRTVMPDVGLPPFDVGSGAQISFLNYPSFFTSDPPSIYQWLSSCLKGEKLLAYPYLPGICERSKLVALSFAQYILGDETAVSNGTSKYLSKITAGQRKQQLEDDRRCSLKPTPTVSSLAEKLVVWMTNIGEQHYTSRHKQYLITFHILNVYN
ncbi:unnamed protein product [Ranitomeya imitator]|uniref:Anaphase-promoting complex subunit 1 middle domain-containing protein n=1 Tax=Ranitomeya imitator TaxID=111125 RepID=A0ABN9L2S7_9NEOB|nr:unnamed protein product [Ranitomeya imitator]